MNKHIDFVKAIVINGIRDNISIEHTASMVVSVLSVVDKDFPKNTDGIDIVIDVASDLDDSCGISQDIIRKWLSAMIEV